jgi:hypothetical protein
MPYWHWSCEHRAPAIAGDDFLLRPHAQVMLGRTPLVWFTSSALASREALGLSSTRLRCDRMEHLFVVVDEDLDKVHTWEALKREPWFAPFLGGAQLLEAARGTRPILWGVATEPVRVRQLT